MLKMRAVRRYLLLWSFLLSAALVEADQLRADKKLQSQIRAWDFGVNAHRFCKKLSAAIPSHTVCECDVAKTLAISCSTLMEVGELETLIQRDVDGNTDVGVCIHDASAHGYEVETYCVGNRISGEESSKSIKYATKENSVLPYGTGKVTEQPPNVESCTASSGGEECVCKPCGKGDAIYGVQVECPSSTPVLTLELMTQDPAHCQPLLSYPEAKIADIVLSFLLSSS